MSEKVSMDKIQEIYNLYLEADKIIQKMWKLSCEVGLNDLARFISEFDQIEGKLPLNCLDK